MRELEPVPWGGAAFVGCLQEACGAFVDTGSDGDVADRVTRAVAAVPWQSLSATEFFVARGILLAFLIRLSNHPRHTFRAIATPTLGALASADAAEMLPIVAHAFRGGTSAASRQSAAVYRADRRVRHALALVTRSFHRTIRVAELARDVGLSKWHLERLIKQATGLPLRAHVAQARMSCAMHLLGERRASVKEVAARVGYGNPDSFCRDFKRQYGMTPHAWLTLDP